MSNLSNTYPVFEDNQVLTSSQLNDLAIYLDQQTRLTRTKLIGVGVLCGLKPAYDAVANLLNITSGTGVTTEGYLLQLTDTSFDRYRVYTLADGVNYPPFMDPNTALQYNLFELIPVGQTATGSVSVIDSGFMTDKVAILFTECVDVDLQSCLGRSCDDLGINRTFNTRVLVADKAVIDEMIAENNLEFELNFPDKFKLADYVIQRAVYDPSANHSRNYFDFSIRFKTALQQVYTGDPTDLVNKPGIVESIRRTFTVFQPVLEGLYPGGTDPLITIPLNGKPEWNDFVSNSNANGPAYFGVQYFYDFLKDLILAYNEFREVAYQLMSQCCVSSSIFPKHLFLGLVNGVNNCGTSVYRHDFIAAPVTNEQRVARRRLELLHERMVLMIRHFNVPRVHNPLPAALPVIRITPSYEKKSFLSQRAVPYYLEANAVDSLLNIRLESVWNSDKVLTCRSDSAEQFPVLGYDNHDGDPFTATTPVKTPLWFDLDPYNFFRIEGHLRWNVQDAMDEINLWKNEFGLPFNVVAVRLAGTATKEEILQKCNFSDLRSQYTSAQRELSCFLGKVFNHFFITDPSGKATIRPFPENLTKAFADLRVADGSSSVGFMPLPVSVLAETSRAAVPSQQQQQQEFRQTSIITYNPRNPADIESDLLGAMGGLLGALSGSMKLMSPVLEKFDFGNTVTNSSASFIKSYLSAVNYAISIKRYVNEALDQLLHSTRGRMPKEFYFALSQWASEYFWFINSFVSDCTFRRLESIYYEMQYRIKFLQENDPTLFANFISRHPGIEHKAGVEPGGTFVLVYPGQAVTTPPRTIGIAQAIGTAIVTLNQERDEILSSPNQTVDQQLRIAQIDSDLCELYKDNLDIVKDKPRPAGVPIEAAIAPRPLIRFNVGAEDVIADFSLPYLAMCDCECTEIPAPDPVALAIPALNIPAIVEYNTGDYAWIDDSNASTSGCYNIGEALPSVTIPVSPYFSRANGGSIVRLKIVVNNSTGSVGTAFTTARGGQVSVVDYVSNAQAFRYTPSRTFLGIDGFDYVIEVYDVFGNIRLRSNRARVNVTVVPRCKAVTTVVAEAENGIIADPR